MNLTFHLHCILPAVILGLLVGCQSTPRQPAWQPPPPPPEAERTAQFLIGRYAALTNDPQTSARNYMAALKGLSDPGSELLERAIFANLLIGDVKAASRLVERYSGQPGEEAALARLVYGIEQMRLERYESAGVLLSTNDYGGFNELIAESVAAWAVLETDGLEAALGTLSEPVEGRPLLSGLGLANRGLLQSAGGDLEGALASFDALRTRGIRLAVVTEQEAGILDQLGRQDEARIVLSDFRQSAGLNPVIESQFLKTLLKQPLNHQPLNVQQGAALSVYIFAATLATQTNGDVASVYYALALHLDDELDVARTLWADTLDKSGRRNEAVELLEDIEKSSPFYATARGQMAWTLHRDGRDRSAVKIARNALETTRDRNLAIQFGDLLRSQGRHEDAETRFTAVLESDSKNGIRDWRVYFARAKERDTMGRWSEAEADLIAALDVNPTQPDVANYLGYNWIERNQNVIRALELIETAAAARPQSGEIIDSLGWAHYQLGDYEEAVIHLERALDLEPGDTEINEHLGDAYWRVGRRLEAGFQWKRSIRLGVDDDVRARLEEKLQVGLDALGSLAQMEFVPG